MNRSLSLVCAGLCLLVLGPVRAEDTRPLRERLAAIEKAIDARRETLHVPGASLAIVVNDRVVYLKGLGVKDVAKNAPVTPDTLFAIGSSTKAFTAMSVLMAQDDGKLALADAPSRYLPYFSLRDPDADARITIRDLLCHDSGLARTDLSWYTGVISREEAIRVAGFAKPTAKLGATFQYQNVMFAAAGEIVSRVEKKPYEAVIQERILAPLGMTASNLSTPQTEKSPDHALGYVWDEETKAYRRLPMRNLPNIAPAGAINSSARDMAQWVRLMLGGGVYEGKRFVSPWAFEQLTRMQMPIGGKVGYGLGWFVRDWNGHKVVEHGGNIDGFNAQVALMPDQKIGFVLLTNVSASSLGTDTMTTIWKELVGAPELAGGKIADVANTPQPSDPKPEVGDYLLEQAKVTFTVALAANGKLSLAVPGQPTYTLENVGGRKYKLGAPAPDGFFITFRPGKSPTQNEAFLQQPQGDVILVKVDAPPPAAPDPTLPNADELLAKMIAAAGGEAALRRHQSFILRARVAAEEQGLTGESTTWAQAPNRRTEVSTLVVLGKKKIATIREWFDGTNGGTEQSFADPEPMPKDAAERARIDSVIQPLLDVTKSYKSVTVTRKDTIDGEPVFVLVKTPEKGAPTTDYVSSKTFLVVRRDAPSAAGPVVISYSDFRPVDGEMVPFRVVTKSPALGDVVATVESVRFNVSIPADVFRPKAKTARR